MNKKMMNNPKKMLLLLVVGMDGEKCSSNSQFRMIDLWFSALDTGVGPKEINS